MHSQSYYWAGKVPALQFFCSVPFGFNPQQSNAWLYHGGGLDLWREVYARRGMIPFPAGNTGIQMGGWFRSPILELSDFDGLKMRIPGLGGKVLAGVGGRVVLLANSEIFPSLERGIIDAVEWVGPFYDYNLGLHQAARYYYFPGWHEPGTTQALTVNLQAWNRLPEEFQTMLETAAFKANLSGLLAFETKNREVPRKILSLGRVQLRRLPDDVLIGLREASEKIVQRVADSSRESRNVYASYSRFQKDIGAWNSINEFAFSDALRVTGIV